MDPRHIQSSAATHAKTPLGLLLCGAALVLMVACLNIANLMLARGASDSTQHAIGTGVFGGMISGTLLAIFFVPVFFIVVARFVENARKV